MQIMANRGGVDDEDDDGVGDDGGPRGATPLNLGYH